MIHEALEWVAIVIDGAAVIVMLIGFVLAIVKFVPAFAKPTEAATILEIQMVRCSLGTYLVFALELMIISDLLHSVISRTLEDLYFLAAIVVLRTIIAYFLNQEIQEIRHEAAA